MHGGGHSQRLILLRAEYDAAWMDPAFDPQRVAKITQELRMELEAMGHKQDGRGGGKGRGGERWGRKYK